MDLMEPDKLQLSDLTPEEQAKLKEVLIRAILQGKEGQKNEVGLFGREHSDRDGGQGRQEEGCKDPGRIL